MDLLITPKSSIVNPQPWVHLLPGQLVLLVVATMILNSSSSSTDHFRCKLNLHTRCHHIISHTPPPLTSNFPSRRSSSFLSRLRRMAIKGTQQLISQMFQSTTMLRTLHTACMITGTRLNRRLITRCTSQELESHRKCSLIVRYTGMN